MTKRRLFFSSAASREIPREDYFQRNRARATPGTRFCDVAYEKCVRRPLLAMMDEREEDPTKTSRDVIRGRLELESREVSIARERSRLEISNNVSALPRSNVHFGVRGETREMLIDIIEGKNNVLRSTG